MKKIIAKKILFIKLGKSGAFGKECIEKGLLKLDYRTVDHKLSLKGDKDKMAESMMGGDVSKKGAASNHARQIISFYHEPADTMWITFYDDKLWWGFANPKVTYDKKTGTKTRKMKGGWKNTSLDGSELSFDRLGEDILKTKGYRGTIAEIKYERKDSLMALINTGSDDKSDTKPKKESQKPKQTIKEKPAEQQGKGQAKKASQKTEEPSKGSPKPMQAVKDANISKERRKIIDSLKILKNPITGIEEDVELRDDPEYIKKVAKARLQTVKLIGGSFEPEDRFNYLMVAAEAGLAEAQNSVGDCYRIGDGIKQNYKIALEWYKLSAEKGHSQAQLSVGMMYRDGLGVDRNMKQTLEWFKLSIEQGNPEAQYILAVMLLEDEVLERDVNAAMQLLNFSAEQRYMFAIETLIGLFLEGELIDRNISKAYFWMCVSEKLGNESYVEIKQHIV